MNPALIEMYMNRRGVFDRNAYNQAILKNWYTSHGLPPPETETPEWMQTAQPESGQPRQAPQGEQLDQSPIGDGGMQAQTPYPYSPTAPMSPALTEPYGINGLAQNLMEDSFISREQQDSADQIQQQLAQDDQQERMTGSNPIQAGAQSAIQATQASRDISEEQRKRALGRAMVGFFSQYAASKNESNLGAINESFNPALNAYFSERDKMLDENYRRDKFEADADSTRLLRQIQAQEAQNKFTDKTEERALKAEDRALKQEEIILKREEREIKKVTDKEERDFKMEQHKLKTEELDMKKEELQIKKQGGGLSQHQLFQQDKHKRGLIKDWHDVQKRKDAELESFTKTLYTSGQKKIDAIEKKKAEIDRKYRVSENAIKKEGLTYGIDFAKESEEVDQAVAQNVAEAAAPAANAGAIDWNNLSEEQLRAMGAK